MKKPSKPRVRFVKTELDRHLAAGWVNSLPVPFRIEIKDGNKATIRQNRTVWLWYTEASQQLGDMSPEEYRAYCKLHFGVGIMAHESPEWYAKYQEFVKPLPYETKLAIMSEPLAFPVTSQMSVKAMDEYSAKVFAFLSGKGVQLTVPGETS